MISPNKLDPRSWVPVWSDPELAADAEALARTIADVGASARILALARDVAEAQVDQRRVRQARVELEKSLSGNDFRGPPSFVDLLVAAKLEPWKPAAQNILAIDRYDRRAFSRWKKAIRALDAAIRRQDFARARRFLKK